MNTPLASLSIAAQVTLDMHSLNNEGGEGNQIQTRMVEIVDQQKRLHSVNAISGDMLKHVLMEHFYQMARAQDISLCASCQRFNANRINADRPFLTETEKIPDSAFLDQVLVRCAIDDVAGILVTEKGRSIHRKSVSEFGWMIGLPHKTRTDSYLHVKYVAERSEQKRAQDAAEQQKAGSNLGQSIFHRPASSGIYALVCHLELVRIGYNDVTQSYAIGQEERQRRCALLLESLLYTFIELNGAMRSAQLPHLVGLEGAITTSAGMLPAPLVSPLMSTEEQPEAYRSQLTEIVTALNGSGGPLVMLETFDTVGEFAGKMRRLLETSMPFATSTRS